MRIFEKVVSLIALVGLILRLLLVSQGGSIFAYSMLALSLMYFFLGFAFFNGVQLRDIFNRRAYADLPRFHIAGGIFTGIALFFACMGILFILSWWPGAYFELIGGTAFCFIVLVISLMKRSAKHSEYYRRIMTRTIVLGSICLLLFFTHQKIIFEIENRNHPAFIKAMEDFQNDPSNQQLKDKMLEEQRKTEKH